MNNAVLRQLAELKNEVKQRQNAQYPGNEDKFLNALGVNEKDFEVPGGGYDYLAALNATAAADSDFWKE